MVQFFCSPLKAIVSLSLVANRAVLLWVQRAVGCFLQAAAIETVYWFQKTPSMRTTEAILTSGILGSPQIGRISFSLLLPISRNDR
ncbi:hypothetical protein B0I72DRAFT_141722 [Yarrowia lipolytica]|uniref:Uncharacterized protein n=1 Tax=Yarrowia lipolytica TaxID=4952 RepID=A0A371C5D9_YARLL|nr:hypothetical protein BKA91DRAFT_132491 [Yarrowia lipolytica]KAE8172467.1 hypothetical protein BKA90DRAFT_137270 [Yarrowia lipolytica]RDW25518.1 hypothetical protein B0I71DRAFT_132412 [Yarrowia lipolytica]RDW30326.1 hypothetical protein B0I72DRAFT_141722 [Yarrowia lipolytica]RDW40625.1 hypothetical protein B0I73DRAFT_129904 [Yarrowia lipolytica]